MATTRQELTFKSRLGAPAEEVWRSITSLEGISRELSPLMRMTAPRGVVELSDVEIRPGQPLFRSWLLLFGILPVDRSDLTLVSFQPGEGFLEESPMLSMKLWRHERRIEQDDAGTVLIDRLTFEPRAATFVVRRLVRFLFDHRHRMLRRRFPMK